MHVTQALPRRPACLHCSCRYDCTQRKCTCRYACVACRQALVSCNTSLVPTLPQMTPLSARQRQLARRPPCDARAAAARGAAVPPRARAASASRPANAVLPPATRSALGAWLGLRYPHPIRLRAGPRLAFGVGREGGQLGLGGRQRAARLAAARLYQRRQRQVHLRAARAARPQTPP